MNKTLKIVLCIVFFGLLALPPLHFLGVDEGWLTIYGYERMCDVPSLTLANFRSRAFQSAFTEDFSKNFFLRKTFLKTAYQLREAMNFGLFHYGYSCSILEGRDGVLYERPYATFHLTCPRPAGKARYQKVMDIICDMNRYCVSNGVDFVFLPMPDKLQLYPEFLPPWFNWLWDYSNYDAQGELAEIFREAGVKVFDASAYLIARKPTFTAWAYPPGGTHLNAYGSGLVYQGFVEELMDTGKIPLAANRFLGARQTDKVWSVDDDISELLNLWHNPHIRDNIRYEPLFAQTNVTLNAGSMITIGDCYREQVALIFRQAGMFAPGKVLVARRGADQDARSYGRVAKDLRLLVLCYQSFNSGKMDEREAELKATFAAIRAACDKARTTGTIVVPKNATPVERFAAADLADGLKRVTGETYSITNVEPASGFRYLIGGDPLDEAPWKQDEIRKVRRGDRLILTGDSVRGPIYAVNDYLERELGVRWWTKDAATWPSRPGFCPPDSLDVRYAPPFAFREALYHGVLTDAAFKVRMRNNVTSLTRYIVPPTVEQFIPPQMGGNHRLVFFKGRRSSYHSFYEILPPDKWFADHPEWYSYRASEGRRVARRGQLCVTNEEMTRAYIRETLRLLHESPDCDVIQVSQNDNEHPCECERCRARFLAEGAWSGPYLEFVNKVAEAVEREFPDVKIDTFAYQFTRKAPKSVRPRQNVLVRLCDIECYFNRPLEGQPAGTPNQTFVADLEAWSRIADGRLYIWDYQANFSSYMLPHPNLHVFADNIRTFRRFGAAGVFEQGDAMCPVGDFAELKQYVTSRLLWNPDLDWRALRDEFLDGYYGTAAAPHLRRALAAAEASVRRADVPGMRCYHTNVVEWISTEAAREAMDEMNAALAAARNDDAEHARRVVAAKMSWDHARILNWTAYGETGSRAEAIRDWIRNLEDFKVDAYRETVTRKTLEDYLNRLRLEMQIGGL